MATQAEVDEAAAHFTNRMDAWYERVQWVPGFLYGLVKYQRADWNEGRRDGIQVGPR